MTTKTQKKLTALILLFCLMLTLTACGNRPEQNPEAPSAAEDNSDFEAFLDELFIEEITDNTISLHYALKDPAAYGIADMEPTFGDLSLDESALAASLAETEALYEKLAAFDYDTLSAKQQVTYDVLKQTLSLTLKNTDFIYYSCVFTSTSGIQSNLPVTMAEYQFYTEKDIKDYLALLEQIPKYMNYCLAYEKKRLSMGLGMPDFIIREAVSQCQDFIADPFDNMLVDTFNDRIDAIAGIPEEQKQAYKEENQIHVEKYVIPAYENLIKTLPTLSGSDANENGVCYFKNGKDYYKYLLARNTGSDKTPEEVIAIMDRRLEECLDVFYETYKKSPAAYQYYYGIDQLDIGITDPGEILEELKVLSLEDYPEPPSCSYSLKYVHESLEDSLSPAFYMIPQVDDFSNQVIYINNGSETESLFATLAHEGYPGHLYQNIYYYNTSPSPIRTQLSFKGYSEGWATYVEFDSYDMVTYAKYDDYMGAIARANRELGIIASCRIDLGVNYEGWSVSDTASYLEANGLNPEAAADIFEYVIQEPTNYQMYYLGCQEFRELRELAQDKLGKEFDLKEFHSVVLTTGPAQFKIVKHAVEAYIEEKLGTVAD